MSWTVLLYEEFEPEFDELPEDVQDKLAAMSELLAEFGPQLARPYVGTLTNSRYPNMKELRFYAADGVWRVAFAFDPQRQAILLVARDKTGVSEKRFYRQLIKAANQRFSNYLATL